MGLDMYLNKKTYIGANYEFNNISGTLALKRDNVPIPIQLNKVRFILEEQAYWRKANQIHRWFVNNVQKGVDDCGTYEVSGEELLRLVDLCKRVLADHTLADSLLPSQDGFFFGSTEYDEYYFEDLENTLEQLKDVDADAWYEYHSSW
ncbi:hypothetical protein IJ750_02645 [bacterium]|nr:hypothetical protein [bacterium]